MENPDAKPQSQADLTASIIWNFIWDMGKKMRDDAIAAYQKMMDKVRTGS
jgi:hypothetical protein